jgi:DNA-binding transcriptional ArsR family regulator
MPRSPAQGAATVPTPTADRRAHAGPAALTAGSPAAASRHVTRDVCEIQCVNELKVQRARQALPSLATIGTLAETLRALGDPTRLQIVAALSAEGVEELCVCDLATLVGVSQSAVSHSLRTLRQLRLVRYRKAGKIAYYRLDDAHVGRLVAEGVRHVEDVVAPHGAGRAG